MNQVSSIFARAGVRLVSPSARANLGAGTHPRISIKGGAFALRDVSGERFSAPIIVRDNVPTLPVVIIGANEQMSRIYFEEDYDDEQGVPPTCFSDNGVGPSTNASVKQARTCAECPHKEWGSAVSKLTGKGIKACHDLKKLAVKVIGDPAGHGYEFQIPPASLKALGRFDAEISQYTAPGTDRPADLTDLITGIQFVPGKTGELQFIPLGFLDAVNANEQGQMWVNWAADGAPMAADDGGQAAAYLIDHAVDNGMVDRLVGNNDQPYGGPLLAAPAAPQAFLEAQPQGGALQRGSTPQQPAPAVQDQSGWRGPPGQPAAVPTRAFVPPPIQQAPEAETPATTAKRGTHGGARAGAGRRAAAAPKTIAGPAPTTVPFPTSTPAAAAPGVQEPIPQFLERRTNGMVDAPAPGGGMMDSVRKAMGLKT